VTIATLHSPALALAVIVVMLFQVVVPKSKGEILGVVIVESGWGSMLPTVVIANLAPSGAAARCGQLNIGDQIIAINGVSLVGLPLSTCQNYIKVRGDLFT
jgi:C-terminal processing protease CtpA/Prc